MTDRDVAKHDPDFIPLQLHYYGGDHQLPGGSFQKIPNVSLDNPHANPMNIGGTASVSQTPLSAHQKTCPASLMAAVSIRSTTGRP